MSWRQIVGLVCIPVVAKGAEVEAPVGVGDFDALQNDGDLAEDGVLVDDDDHGDVLVEVADPAAMDVHLGMHPDVQMVVLVWAAEKEHAGSENVAGGDVHHEAEDMNEKTDGTVDCRRGCDIGNRCPPRLVQFHPVLPARSVLKRKRGARDPCFLVPIGWVV